jgi:hypothetical protein
MIKEDKMKITQSFLKKIIIGASAIALATGLFSNYRLSKGEEYNEFSTFSQRGIAYEELERKGITKEREPISKKINKFVYNRITPMGYYNTWITDKNQQLDFSKNRNLVDVLLSGRFNTANEIYSPEKRPAREDAWRFYLGLPQKNKTFEVSKFRPSKSKDNKYYYKISNWKEKFVNSLCVEEDNCTSIREIVTRISQCDNKSAPYGSDGCIAGNVFDNEYIEFISEFIDPAAHFERFYKSHLKKGILKEHESVIAYDDFWNQGSEDSVMSAFILSKDNDKCGNYISYYDKWDLEINPFEGLIGRPFEIYDRIYYNPQNFEEVNVQPENCN